MRQRILIDVTDLQGWKGSYTGVQRVNFCIGDAIANQSTDQFEVCFIAFNRRSDSFYFVPRPQSSDHQSLVGATNSKPANTATESRRGRMSTRGKVTRAFDRLKKKISEKKKMRQEVKVGFGPQDVILMMGLTWGAPERITAIRHARERSSVKLMQVIYDLIICLYPHLHRAELHAVYTEYMRFAIQSSDQLFPISESTRRDLSAFATQQQLTCPKLSTIRLGDNLDNTAAIAPHVNLAKNYILCVGTIEIRKNQILLYQTYKLAESRGLDLPQLCIVGRRGWLSGDIQHLIDNDPAVQDKILLIDDADDGQLAYLYENCLFTIYPSIYEGWGLPIAESLARNKPCLASSTSSMPEVGGNLVDYFCPFDVNECLERIEAYLDENTRSNKIALINSNYNKTSWGHTAMQVLECI